MAAVDDRFIHPATAETIPRAAAMHPIRTPDSRAIRKTALYPPPLPVLSEISGLWHTFLQGSEDGWRRRKKPSKDTQGGFLFQGLLFVLQDSLA